MSPKNPSPFAVDIETLLAPISADKPSGESLRYTAVFDEIKKLRTEDDPALPMGVWQKPLKKADWPAVALLCLDALETRTKDLQLAGWLTEAWTELGGLYGLQRGLQLIAALAESFWPDLHPQLQDDDLAYRLAPLLWLDGQLPLRLKRLTITSPQGAEAVPYDWIAFESSRQLANLARADARAAQKAIERGGVSEEKFLVSVSLTPTDFYLAVESQLEDAQEALDQLGQVMDQLAGDESPSFPGLRSQLGDLGHLVAAVLNERREAGELPDHGDPAETGGGPAGGHGGLAEGRGGEFSGAVRAGRIKSRADAYRMLAEAAEYLARTEPHSPVPYLVRRAVGWGNFTLAELLRELLAEQSDLRTINKLLGIKEGRD